VPIPIRCLLWGDNVEHLWASHRVTPEEVEEIVFGFDGQAPSYRVRRDGDAYIVYGETGDGRLLKMVGTFAEGRAFRVFGAIDMDIRDRRVYRRGKV